MSFIMRNETFVCTHCGADVSIHPTGSARNHCPHCIYSLHVDSIYPGDRESTCGGQMRPIDIEYRRNKWYMVVHECTVCRKKIPNIVAPDDDYIWLVRRLNIQKEKQMK